MPNTFWVRIGEFWSKNTEKAEFHWSFRHFTASIIDQSKLAKEAMSNIDYKSVKGEFLKWT